MSYVSISEAAKAVRLDREVNFIDEILNSFSSDWCSTRENRKSIRFFLECLGMHSVEVATNKAVERFDDDRNGGDIFAYFCGVCWIKMIEMSMEGK